MNRPVLFAVAVAAAVVAIAGCSSQPPRERPDAGGRAARHERDGAVGSPAADGGAAAPGARWAGTIRGATEVPDGGLPDGATPWSGEGTLRLDVRGDEVEGRVEASGMVLDARGNLADGALRAWLRAPSGQPRTEGVLVGDREGSERLRGTWRVSGPAGAEVRAGTFEASHP